MIKLNIYIQTHSLRLLNDDLAYFCEVFIPCKYLNCISDSFIIMEWRRLINFKISRAKYQKIGKHVQIIKKIVWVKWQTLKIYMIKIFEFLTQC